MALAEQDTKLLTAGDTPAKDAPLRFKVEPLEFTYNAVVPNLFQGDFPYEADWTQFDDVVSMTAEAAPKITLRLGGLWLYVPIYDDRVEDPSGIRVAAQLVAERVRAGRRVLVHCAAGLNRSGIVSARALMFMGHTPGDAIAMVRSARGMAALSNAAFVRWLYDEGNEPVPASEGRLGHYDPDREDDWLSGLTADEYDALWDSLWKAAKSAEKKRGSKQPESAPVTEQATDMEAALA